MLIIVVMQSTDFQPTFPQKIQKRGNPTATQSKYETLYAASNVQTQLINRPSHLLATDILSAFFEATKIVTELTLIVCLFISYT